MKTIKLTIFSILGATLLGLGLYSCSNDDTTGVNELEKTNVSKNTNRKVVSNIELEYEAFLTNLAKNIENKNLKSQKEIDNFIAENGYDFNYSFTTEETKFIEDFFIENDYNYESLDMMEKEIQNTKFINKDDLISLIKLNKGFENFRTTNSTIGKIKKFENYLDNCMKDRLGDVFNRGNFLDKAFFMLGTPATTAELVASCTLDYFN